MADKPGFDIIIEENGDFNLEVFGVVGPECEKLTAGIAEALGTGIKKTKKPEYHQHAARTRTVTR